MKKLAYFCSEYPALSHTFITREITILEAQGFQILPVSVNPTKNLEKMGPEDQRRAAETFTLKAVSKGKILGTLFTSALRLPSFLKALGFTVHLAVLNGPRDALKALGYFIQALLLARWGRKNNVTHVHVHFANPAATVALIATRLGLSFSLSVHGPDEFYDVEKNNLQEKIKEAVFVRCIGYFCRSQLMRLSPLDQWKKFHIVRCGLHLEEFSPRPPVKAPARKILCVGRVCPSKGQAILLQAAQILKTKGRDFEVLFLGGGEDLEALKRRTEEDHLTDKVTFAGPVGHQRVKEELLKADLFVLPSFAEGIPVALMEAMAAGVPVVSTNITGIPELIEHGVDGFLTQASNAEQLAQVIDQVLTGAVDLSPLIAQAQKKVAQWYNVDQNTQELGRIFADLEG